MQLNWKTKHFYPLYTPYPDSHEEKQLLRLFSLHLEAFLFKVWFIILPFHPLFLLKWWCRVMSEHCSAKRQVYASLGLRLGCANGFCYSMDYGLNCTGFKISESKRLKLVDGFASRKWQKKIFCEAQNIQLPRRYVSRDSTKILLCTQSLIKDDVYLNDMSPLSKIYFFLTTQYIFVPALSWSTYNWVLCDKSLESVFIRLI